MITVYFDRRKPYDKPQRSNGARVLAWLHEKTSYNDADIMALQQAIFFDDVIIWNKTRLPDYHNPNSYTLIKLRVGYGWIHEFGFSYDKKQYGYDLDKIWQCVHFDDDMLAFEFKLSQPWVKNE
jgi:hypothetical protein